MKKKVGKRFYQTLGRIIKIKLSLYKLLNYNKKKLFLFTDSRGYIVTGIFNKYNPFSSYASFFVKKFNSEVYVCPEKSTTVYDFLTKYNESNKDFEYVIAHVGVVDFAARPITQARQILEDRKNKIIKLFDIETYNQLILFNGYEDLFGNEKTSSTVPEFMVEKIADKFNEINNLIWITCNPVDLNWNGNYPKTRPKNINMINDKSINMRDLLKRASVIDITNWSFDEVHKYTCDNVHLSERGMDYIKKKIREIVE